MDVEPAARKHGVDDDDMFHAVRHHWRAFETDDPAVTMFIGPSMAGEALEIGVVEDDAGAAVIHAMAARSKFLKGGGRSEHNASCTSEGPRGVGRQGRPWRPCGRQHRIASSDCRTRRATRRTRCCPGRSHSIRTPRRSVVVGDRGDVGRVETGGSTQVRQSRGPVVTPDCVDLALASGKFAMLCR